MENNTVKIHSVKFANGNSVEVSELINNEAVRITLGHNAGMAKVTTEIYLSEQGAKELGKLLVKYHNSNEENLKALELADLKEKCSELESENKKLIEEKNTLLTKKKKTV